LNIGGIFYITLRFIFIIVYQWFWTKYWLKYTYSYSCFILFI